MVFLFCLLVALAATQPTNQAHSFAIISKRPSKSTVPRRPSECGRIRQAKRPVLRHPSIPTSGCFVSNAVNQKNGSDDRNENESIASPESLRKYVLQSSKLAGGSQAVDNISLFEAERLLRQELVARVEKEFNKTDKSHDELQEGTKEYSNSSSTSSFGSEVGNMAGGIQLTSNEYVQLSQNVDMQNQPQIDLASDVSNSDFFRKFSNQAQGKNIYHGNKMVADTYRAVARSLAQPRPDSPGMLTARGRYPNLKRRQPSEEDLWKAWQEAYSKRNRTSEEMHERVFLEEEGFLKQSKMFRQSLTNSSKTRETLAKRRASDYEMRQAAAREKLEKQMQEMQAILRGNQLERCPMCFAIMSPETWKASRKLYDGKYICDICYAEKCFVSRRTSNRRQPFTRNYKYSKSPNQYESRAPRVPSTEPIIQDTRRKDNVRKTEKANTVGISNIAGMNTESAKLPTAVNLTNDENLKRRQAASGSEEVLPDVSMGSNKTPLDERPLPPMNVANTTNQLRMGRGNGDWVKSFDPENQQTFYWNRVTNKVLIQEHHPN